MSLTRSILWVVAIAFAISGTIIVMESATGFVSQLMKEVFG